MKQSKRQRCRRETTPSTENHFGQKMSTVKPSKRQRCLQETTPSLRIILVFLKIILFFKEKMENRRSERTGGGAGGGGPRSPSFRWSVRSLWKRRLENIKLKLHLWKMKENNLIPSPPPAPPARQKEKEDLPRNEISGYKR